MKINLLSTTFVAILALATLSSTVTAQAKKSADAPTATALAGATKFAGKIEAISATSITVKHKKSSLVMVLTPQTKFGGKKAPETQADFAVGDEVKGIYSVGSDGSKTIASLHKKHSKK